MPYTNPVCYPNTLEQALPATNNFSSTDAAILAPYTDAVAITIVGLY